MPLSTINNSLDIKDNKSFALRIPSSINNYVLLANTPINIALSDLVDSQSKQGLVIDFSSDNDFYVKWNGTNAAVPSVNVTDGTGVELNPSTRILQGDMTNFSIVSPTLCIISMKIFSY